MANFSLYNLPPEVVGRLREDQKQLILDVDGDPSKLTREQAVDIDKAFDEIGDLRAGAKIAESQIRTGLAGIGSLLGFDEFAQDQLEEAQDEAEELEKRYTRDVPTFDSIQDIGDFGEYLKETAATSLIPTAIGLGGGVVGGIAGTAVAGPAGGVAGALAGATAFGTPFFTGSNINRQMEELGLSFEDANKAKALGVGVGQAALDSVIGRLFGLFGRGAPQEITKYAAPTIRGRAVKLGKKVGEGAVIEGITEPAQQALELIQANPDKFFEMPPEVRAELTEAAIAGGLLGGILGGVTSPFTADPTAEAKEDLDRHAKELQQEQGRRQFTINKYEEGVSDQRLLSGPRAPRPVTETVRSVTQPSIEGAPPAPAELSEDQALAKALGTYQVELDLARRDGDLEKVARIENFEIPRIERKIEERQQARETDARLQAAVETVLQQARQMPVVIDPEIESRNKIDNDPVTENANLTDEEAVGLSDTVQEARDVQVGKQRESETAEDFELEAPEGQAPTAMFESDVQNMEVVRAFNRHPELNDAYNELIELESQAQPKAFPINAKKKQIRDILKGEPDYVVDTIVNETPSQKQDILQFSQIAQEEDATQARKEATKFIDEIAPQNLTIDEKRDFDRQVERVRKMVGRRLRKLGLKEIDVELSETTNAGTEGSMATRAGRFIMKLAYKYVRPGMTDKQVYTVLRQVMNHEMIHAMKQMGLFTAKEWSTLTQTVRSQRYVDNQGNVRKFSYFDRAAMLYSTDEQRQSGGYDSLEAMQEEEAIAELFRDFNVPNKRDKMLKDQRGVIKRIFDKIVKFFGGIGEDAHKEAQDIFESIESGELGRRERNSAVAEYETDREARIQRDIREPVADLQIKTDIRGLRYQDVIEERADDVVERRRYIDTTAPKPEERIQTSKEILGEKVHSAYREMALYQRGRPEASMVLAQAALKGYPRGFHQGERINMPEPMAYGEDTFGTVLEHTNDLLHRAFGQNHGAEFYPEDNSVEKARRMLDYMQGYGEFPTYKEVVAKEFRDHAKAFGMTLGEFSAYITPFLNNYIDAHASIPVYNEVQQYMNDAAIAVGQLDFDKARGNLNAFLNAYNAGEDAYFDAIQPVMVDAGGNPVNLKESTERESRIEPPKINKDGTVVGAPPGARTKAARTGLVNKLVRMMDHPFALTSKSAYWYEESGKAIREVTRGDPELMDRVARLMALYSQGNSVGGNTTAVVKSMYQIARGEESIEAGRFPSTTAEVIPDLLAATEFTQDLKGVSDKIENFYRNLIDPARGTNTYDEASTMDKWMMRLFGYKVADDEEVGGSANLTKTQYRYARDLINRVADSWEKKTGQRLMPRQVQAALWTYKKNMDVFQDMKAEGKVKKEEEFTPKDVNFNDYLIRATANIAWEARPSESLPIIPWIHSAPRTVQNKFNYKIRNLLHEVDGTDRVMSLLTTGQLYNGNLSSGGYEGRAVPNAITRLVLERDDQKYVYDTANQYSALLGYILKQDAVAWFQPIPDNEATADSSVGYHIEFSQRLTPEQEQQFQQELNNKLNLEERKYNKKQREAGLPEAIEDLPNRLGFTRIGDGYFVVNFRMGDPSQRAMDDMFKKILDNALAKVPVEAVQKYDRVRVNSGYISNDWSTNPNGEAYQSIFGPDGFGDLQNAADRIADEVTEATREFSRDYGSYATRGRYDASSSGKRLRTSRDFIPRSTEQGQLSVRDYPTYVTGRQGPESARSEYTGYHYSNTDNLPTLDSAFHGTGKAGDELKRLPRDRVMFYAQGTEELPLPEIELGGLKHGYGVKLTNIYDKSKDDYIPQELDRLGLQAGTDARRDAFEQMVLDEGYDGYYNSNEGNPSGPTITILGESKVPVIQTMKDRQRISATAEFEKFSSISPTANFGTFINEVIAEDKPSGPFTNIARKFFGAAPGEKLRDAFFRNTVNRFLPAQELDVRAYGTSFDNADSVFRSMELSQQLVGRMQALMELGPIQIDPDGNITQVENAGVGGINEIFRPLFDGMNKKQADEQERQFFAYAIARREQALRAKGRKGVSKQTDQQIADVVNSAPQMYQDVFNNFQKFNEFTIQMGIDSGILTTQMADNFRDMAYVPFYREFGMDEEQDFGDALPRRAANTLNNPNAFDKRLLGSEEKLKPDLLENIFRNQQAILSAALKNVAMQKTAKAIETLNAMGQNDIGVRVDVKESGPQIARFRVNGQEVAYKIKDGSMWKAIAGLTPPQKQGFIKAAETFANILRFGVTNMPGFMLANLWRGKVDAYVKLGNPMLRLDQTLKGAANVYSGQTEAMAIKLLTGFGGYGYGADPSDFSTTARRNIRTQGKIYNNQGFLEGLQNLKQKMERIGEATEMGERVVIYERMIADGVSPREAAFQAMNLINYGRRGAGGGTLGGLIVHALIPSIPFLNARIQGLYRLGESQDQSPEARRRIWMGIMTRGMMLSMASLLMYATAMDEEEYENESLENKINYDYIYVGDGNAIKLPRAFEIGSLFGTLPVMLMETIRQEDGSDLAKATIMTFANTFSFNPVPQVFMPALEVATGHDFFRGSPIEGGSLKNKLTEERYYESTPYMYRWLSRNGGALVDLSPVEIQQLMEGYLAGFGGLIAGVGDTVLSATGLVPSDPNGVFGDPYVTRLGNVAGLSRFIAVDGERSSRFTKEFYEIKRTIDQYHRAVQDAAQRGDTERVQELMEKKGAAMTFRKAFGQVSRQIATINNAIAQVSQSPTMSSSEKTERLRALRKQKNELTKRFVKMAKTTGYF